MRVLRVLFLLPALFCFTAPVPAGAARECRECHELSALGDGSRSSHSPFAAGRCGACHLDHGDEKRLVLRREGNALCGQCHDREEEDFLLSHGGIGGDGASCLSCHDPHRSSLTTLLRPGRHRPLAYGRCDPCHRFDGRLHQTKARDLCFECHDREEHTRKYGHPPSVEGACLQCHDPHGSRQRSLLLAPYTDRGWTEGGDEDHALCLNCHRAEIFTASGGEETTDFRSGATNLHKLHVEGISQSGKASADRGLTCRNCHEVHSSPYPNLIRSSLDCDGVPCLKLEFRNIPGGGTCSVSCHGTKSYLRSGEEPEPAPPPAPAPPPPPVPSSAFPAAGTYFAEPTPLERSINRRCRSCHQDDVQSFSRSYVHLPVRQGNCSACHLDHGPDNKLVLLDREDRLCSRCHDLKGEDLRSAHRGYPLARAACGECHDPHSSSRPFLLYPLEHEPFAKRDCGACHKDPSQGWALGEEISSVCDKCHDGPSSFAFTHGAVKSKGCTGCHLAHAGRTEKFLRAGIPKLCFRCHTESRFDRQTVHAPVEKGACGACHLPHGSNTASLLALPYPGQQYLSYSEEAYLLCWKCHEAESLTDPASLDTGFRDGSESLHSLHLLNRTIATELGERTTRGVTCRSCHDPHSSRGPRLIVEELDCGGVPCLQLEFHKIGEGGKCLGGCHTRQSYLPSE